MNDKDILQQYIDDHGEDYVMMKTVEELNELATEIIKNQNNISRGRKSNTVEIVKEMVDVDLRLRQVKMLFGMSDYMGQISEENITIYNDKQAKKLKKWSKKVAQSKSEE